MTAIKICGLRRVEDVHAADGADYLGFVIGTGTRRSLEMDDARGLMELTDRPTVAVTTSTDVALIGRMAEVLSPFAVQLNSSVGCKTVTALKERLRCEVWMAVHIGSLMPDIDPKLLDLPDCVVLDSACPEGGGSGQGHDHRISARVAQTVRGRVSLAGGLTPRNVSEAISTVHPDIVDVSSGVETNGVKDAQKIALFIEEVRRCQ